MADPGLVEPAHDARANCQREADRKIAFRSARELHYVPDRNEFRFVLNSGATIIIPSAMIGYGFEKLTPVQLQCVRLNNTGSGIELRELDVDLSVSGIIRDVFGFGELQQLRAARARTPKKAAASRANGAKGGRPRKTAASPQA